MTLANFLLRIQSCWATICSILGFWTILRLECFLSLFSTAAIMAPVLLARYQVWYFDHSTEDKNKNVMESMLQEEKKHFLISSSVTPANTPSANTAPKVSPIWTKEDIDLLKKGIVSLNSID